MLSFLHVSLKFCYLVFSVCVFLLYFYIVYIVIDLLKLHIKCQQFSVQFSESVTIINRGWVYQYWDGANMYVILWK